MEETPIPFIDISLEKVKLIKNEEEIIENQQYKLKNNDKIYNI